MLHTFFMSNSNYAYTATAFVNFKYGKLETLKVANMSWSFHLPTQKSKGRVSLLSTLYSFKREVFVKK